MADIPPSTTQGSIQQNERPWMPHQLPAAFGLILLCVLAYWPLIHAGYIWDDNVWLTDNPLVQHWNGLWYIWFAPLTSTQYYPLVYTAFLLQFKLWGLNPLGYHLVNIVLQAINAVLLWRILRLLGLKSAWIVAAIFAIHPIQVETVGWITEQKNLLSAAFGFSAALLWIKWAGLDVTAKMPVPPETFKENPGQGRGYVTIIAATVLFVLALLSKTDICTLPVVLLLLAWWKNGHVRRREILSVIPWLFIGAILAGITIYIEHGTAEATGPVFAFSLSQRLIIAGKDFWFYPLKLLWPYPLLAVYPRWDIEHFTLVDWLFPVTALLLPVILLLAKRKIGRGPFAAIAYYGIVISPVLGFTSFYTMMYTFVADHYQYLAGIGIITLVMEPIAVGWERFGAYLKKMETEKQTTGLMLFGGRALPIIATGAVLLELGTLTWAQSELYREPEGIWQYVLNYDPHSWFAWDQLASYDFQKGNIKDGQREAAEAYEITAGHNFYADAVLGVALTNMTKGNAAGMGLLEQSLQLNPYQPYYLALLAIIYENQGEKTVALEVLRSGLNLMPNNPTLNVVMGDFSDSEGDYQGALEDFDRALEFKPMQVRCLFDDSVALEKLGRTQEALDEFQKMLNVDYNDPTAQMLYAKLLNDRGRAPNKGPTSRPVE